MRSRRPGEDRAKRPRTFRVGHRGVLLHLPPRIRGFTSSAVLTPARGWALSMVMNRSHFRKVEQMPSRPKMRPRRALPRTRLTSAVQVPKNFTIDEVPFRPGVAPPDVADDAPDLGPLKAFTGTFTGRGFNTIFRPHNPSIPIGLDIEPPPSDNVLELNLTIETLSFHDKLGKVPNRGLLQADIELNGVPYLQSISDVT